jgi:DNA end-binding protein Ku
MIRSVWSGTLSFGLVVIPVKLYPATEPKDVRFHLVDAESGRRVRYRRIVEGDAGSSTWNDPDTDAGWDPSGGIDRALDRGSDVEPGPASDPDPPDGDGPSGDGPAGPGPGGPAARDRDRGVPGTESRSREVPFESLARGYEVEPGVLVTLTQDEIRSALPAPSRTIEIEDFVELDAIDPVYFEKSYVVAPQAGEIADRPYALLLRALERSGRVGIGRFVLRTKPHLVAIRPRAGALGLETLFFGDEVRDPSNIVEVAAEVGERELVMADRLIEMLAVDWDPSRYADTYREELRALIASRTPRRREPPAAAVQGAPSEVERLMDALQESVARAKREAAKGSRRNRGRAETG